MSFRLEKAEPIPSEKQRLLKPPLPWEGELIENMPSVDRLTVGLFLLAGVDQTG